MDSADLKTTIDNLVSGELGIGNLSFEEIVQYISKTYNKFSISEGEIFEKNYCKLLLRSLETGDKELMVNSLQLLLNNSQLISVIEKAYIDERNEKMKTFSDYCFAMIHAEYYRNICRISDRNYRNNDNEKKDYFTGKCAVYCVITGDYDEIRNPEVIIPGADYYFFTNNKNAKSDVWNVIQLENPENLSNVLLQRKTKIIGHEILDKYDYTVYIDGKFQIVGDLDKYISTYSKGQSMLCFPHPSRNTIEAEADAIVSFGKDTIDKMDSQIERYRSEGFKDDYGVVETACLVRSNRDVKLKAVMNDWWMQIVNCSHRDQMSLPYVCWKNDYVFDYCDLHIYQNNLIKPWGHK